MKNRIAPLLSALLLAVGLMVVVGAQPAAAATCVDRKVPRVEFNYNKPLSGHDTVLQADLFYSKCVGNRWWVKPTMLVMTWDVVGQNCRGEFDYIVWELYAYDSEGHKMTKTFKQYCDGTGADTRAVSYQPKNVPQLLFATHGTYPDLAPKWQIKAEIVRDGPVINSHYLKKGAFPLQ